MNNIKNPEDLNDVRKLEIKDSEMYSTLCIMHLSFLLDLSNEELEIILESRNKSIRNESNIFKSKKADKENISSFPLTQEGVCRIYQLIQFLEKDYNICQKGLFRKTGNVNKQQQLRNIIYNGNEIDLDSSDYGVHDCASVLKYYLSDMPEPLLTEAHFHAHCQISEMYKNENDDEILKKRIKATQLLFLLLPPENKSLLKDLLMLLYHVTEASKDNCMDATNLATIFGPHILFPRKISPQIMQEKLNSVILIVKFMIENAPELFHHPPELTKDAQLHLSNNELKFSEPKLVQTEVAFCSRKTLTENDSTDYTKYALADLYAHLQSMPDSAKKRKYLKQFNNHNRIVNGVKSPAQYLKKGIKKKLFGGKFKEN